MPVGAAGYTASGPAMLLCCNAEHADLARCRDERKSRLLLRRHPRVRECPEIAGDAGAPAGDTRPDPASPWP